MDAVSKYVSHPAKAKNGTIEFYRFLFTVLIMTFHTSAFLGEETQICVGGYIGVDFFFLVSGFLMARSMSYPPLGGGVAHETISFMKRKVVSIFPQYILCWSISFVTTQILQQHTFFEAFSILSHSILNIFMLEMAGCYNMGHYLGASWYISAMLISMLFLFPIRRRNPDIFDFIFAPLLGLFLISYAFQFAGNLCLVVAYDVHLFLYDGMIRAAAEISLGCMCFSLCSKFCEHEFTFLARICISLLEIGGYACVFIAAWTQGYTQLDFTLLICLGVSITLSFSQKGILFPFFQNRFCLAFGKLSLPLYLTHMLVAEQIIPYFINLSAYQKLAVYYTICLGLSCIWVYVDLIMSKRQKRKTDGADSTRKKI